MTAGSGAPGHKPEGQLSGLRSSGLRAWRPLGSLTRRIIALNVIVLGLMLVGVLYVNTLREGLIEARVRTLMTQGEIIAGAVGQGATRPEANVVQYRLARRILQQLALPTQTRARLFANTGLLLADTRDHWSSGRVMAYDLPAPGEEDTISDLMRDFWNDLWRIAMDADLPLYHERPDQIGQDYEEVIGALNGYPSAMVRVNSDGETIVSVAVPVQRFKAVLGALMLSTEAGDIDEIARIEQTQIFLVFGVVLAAAVLASLLLASTIAIPVRRLSNAAYRVRTLQGRRIEIPDMTYRRDELGDLSGALRDMTDALYNRIDAIERFAADVAHEIKNPLTSLKSAVETLPLTKTEEQRERLVGVILHDVARLDRLISDISNASRVDAELSREESGPVDLQVLMETLVDVMETSKALSDTRLVLADGPKGDLVIDGIESRIGQVVQNLLTNALSFSPPGGSVTLAAKRSGRFAVITVEDEGPGIQPDKLTEIFDRFYTERPEAEGFGNHSGLGLAISKQIVDAHGGTIRAENRSDRTGARFIVSLPLSD